MAEAVPSPHYTCLICLQQYNQPRELSCHHTFCCKCLEAYINKEHVAADEGRLYCPVCESPTIPRDPSQPVSKWAASLPPNHLFIKSTLQMPDDQVCNACQRDDDSSPAEVWCRDCKEFLCKQCGKAHKRSKVSTEHVLVPATISVSEDCPNHDRKTLDVYCLDHNVMCCSVCVSLLHRNCGNIKSIKDVAKKTMTDKHLHETEWGKITEEVRKMLHEDKSKMINLDSSEKETSDKMTRVVKLAKYHIDDLNKTFQSDLSRKCNMYREQLSARLRHITTFQANADNSHALMSQLGNQADHLKTFITREQAKHQLSAHHRRLDQNIKNQPNTFDITLGMATIIAEIMKLASLGNIDVTPSISQAFNDANVSIDTMLKNLVSTPSSSSFADSFSSSDLAGSLERKVDVWTGSVSLVHTVKSLTLPGKSRVYMTGGITTDNGELLVSDYNNKCLILFDDTYSYLREYPVDGSPDDIARGKTDEDILVAVDRKLVLICSLKNGLLSVRYRIKSPKNTWRITVYEGNILAGTDGSVDVLSMDGEVIKSIKARGHVAYIGVYRSAVYHRDNDDIVCTGLDDGNEKARYSHPDLRGPRGIGLDADGNVYVCALDSGNVHIVSPDLSRGRILLPKLSGITKPYAIAVQPTKQGFVVTSLKEPYSLNVYRFNDNVM